MTRMMPDWLARYLGTHTPDEVFIAGLLFTMGVAIVLGFGITGLVSWLRHRGDS